MAEEEQGFIIRDRRGRGAESESGSSSESAGAGMSGADSATSPQSEHAQAHQPVPPITFLSFVYSMGTSALMLLGESPPNLSHAQEIIDILTMLETKTKGNLTDEEETLLQEMLYALRVKYVEKASGKKA